MASGERRRDGTKKRGVKYRTEEEEISISLGLGNRMGKET